MCVLAVYNGNDRLIATFNRDEMKESEFDSIGSHWSFAPGITGYYDNKSKGTWLSWSESMIGFLLNREQDNYFYNGISRGMIILDFLSSCRNIREAKKFLENNTYTAYSPFNLVLIDTFYQILYISNRDKNGNPSTNVVEVNEKFFMLNRSYLNDFSQARILHNYHDMFEQLNKKRINQPTLSKVLLRETYCERQEDETTMFLESDQWCTRVSTIAYIRNGKITVKSLFER